MNKALRRRHFILSFFIIYFLFLSILSYPKNSYAQANGETLNPSSEFQLTEFSEQIGTNGSINTIKFPIASTSWNVTNIEMNFTDIRLGKEIKTVEETGDSIKLISWKEIKGYGVQINITEPTTIFAVYIYTYYIPVNPSLPVYVQIQGYDNPSRAPNNTIFTSTNINISEIPKWYYQEFNSPVILYPGQYYLVINGTSLGSPSDKSIYNWFYNQSSTRNPLLHTAVHDGIDWSEEAEGKPFLHKLVERIDRSFTPDEVNMTLEIEGFQYPVESNGSLIVTRNFNPNTELFNIPIFNNRSIELLFNLSYHIKLKNIKSTLGYALIQEGLPINWTIELNLQRCFCNYSVKFIYPKNWYNLDVFRNLGIGWENISAETNIDTFNHLIYILNDSIPEEASWRFTAKSQNLQPSLNVPKTAFSSGQEIQFSVIAPIFPGNLTFRIFNPLGFLAQPEIIYQFESIETVDLILSHQLSSNPYAGIYKAYIFWYNGTAAGVITQEFVISIPFTLDPAFIAVIVGVVAFISVFSFTTYKLVKNSKRKHDAHRQKIFNKYMDVLNLEYFIIIHKKSGLNVYEQILASKTVDASLITGFLEAIRTFGIELTGADEQSQTIKLEYQKSKVLMSEFKSFRILLIMKENPSQDFLESIKELSYDIDNKYGRQIETFKGNISPFSGIRDLLEQHLQTSLIFPLEITEQNIKLKSDEKSMVNRAKSIMKKKNTDYFIVTNLLSIKKGFYAKEAEIILNLIKKKIFQPKI